MIKLLIFLLFSAYVLQVSESAICSPPSLSCTSPVPCGSCSCDLVCCNPSNPVPGACDINPNQAGGFALSLLFENLNCNGIVAAALQHSLPLQCLVNSAIGCYTTSGVFDLAKFRAAVLYSLVISPSITNGLISCTSTTASLQALSRQTTAQIIQLIYTFVRPNPYYRDGHCARDHVSCTPVIAESQGIGTGASEIVSVTNLRSKAFSGLVAHVDGTAQFINCHYTPLLLDVNGAPKWTFQLPYLTSLTAFDAVVLDEKTMFMAGVEATATLIAGRFIGGYSITQLSPVVSGTGSGIVTFILMSSPQLGGIIVQPNGIFLDPTPIREDQITVQADRERFYFYYMGTGATHPDHTALVRLTGVELTISSTAILGSLPLGSPVSALETAFHARVLRARSPISTFQLCDCRIAVGYFDGSVRLYCCQSMQPLGCAIPPVCRCEERAIPTRLRWCCCSRTLFVLYTVFGREHPQFVTHRKRTFIEAYRVDIEPHVYDCSERKCFERLYSIHNCRIINFEVCCQRPCPIVYVLLENNGKWYIRAYADGKELATARLERRVARGSMALSICGDRRVCKCCHCGVFIPFHVDYTVSTELQQVVCLCIKQCGGEERFREDREL